MHALTNHREVRSQCNSHVVLGGPLTHDPFWGKDGRCISFFFYNPLNSLGKMHQYSGFKRCTGFGKCYDSAFLNTEEVSSLLVLLRAKGSRGRRG